MNPLDAFARDSVKKKLAEVRTERGNEPARFQAVLTNINAEVTADSKWIKKAARACGGAPKRSKLVMEYKRAAVTGTPRQWEVWRTQRSSGGE